MRVWVLIVCFIAATSMLELQFKVELRVGFKVAYTVEIFNELYKVFKTKLPL